MECLDKGFDIHWYKLFSLNWYYDIHQQLHNEHHWLWSNTDIKVINVILSIN